MYRHEAPRAEELLDSTAGPNASPNASPSSAHVLSQPLVGSTEPRAHGEVFHHIAQGQQTLATADMLEPELGRPAKRFKLNQPNQPNQWQSFQGIAVPAQGFPAPSMTNNAHQSVPPWPQGQSIIFSPSNNNNLTGHDTLPDFSYRNPQDVQPPSAAPISASLSHHAPPPRHPGTKERRDSALSVALAQPHRESPFRGSRGTVGIRSFHVQGFNGQVSSYLKFQWSKQKPRKPAQRPLDHHLPFQQRGGLYRPQLEIMFFNGNHDEDSPHPDLSTAFSPATTGNSFGAVTATQPHSMSPEALLLNPGYPAFASEAESPWPDSAPVGNFHSAATDISMPTIMSPQEPSTQLSLISSPAHRPQLDGQLFDDWEERQKREEREKREELDKDPKLVPDQFGLPNKLNYYQRRFNVFYIDAWCPGRSILWKTNLWREDFAPMAAENEYIRYAMDSLVGVYIFDYTSAPLVREHTNTSFDLADTRLEELLNRPHLSADEVNETITIMILLAMQDVVFVERRKLSKRPRWLEGFRECERLLQAMDPRERFWDRTSALTKPSRDIKMIQVDSLQLSLSICVCRAVILAQPLMPLPDSKGFNAESETDRFGWLLTGNENDMFAIHGGCGFSKMLLYQFSQVTFLATKLRQEGTRTYSYLFAEALLAELLSMRQFNKESSSDRNTWEAAKQQRPVIDWVREQPQDYLIDQRDEMTDVTAESWRFAAMIYLQCRALRLPRDHPEVMSNIDDLARCIRIMPTSGSLFTAQAPLLPVFLLGMLAVDPTHVQVSRAWFESVVSAPVRSSVPPLYDALQDIWTWIDKEIPLGQQPCESVPERDAWWERLVAVVKKKQKETLCLT